MFVLREKMRKKWKSFILLKHFLKHFFIVVEIVVFPRMLMFLLACRTFFFIGVFVSFRDSVKLKLLKLSMQNKQSEVEEL